MDMRRYVRRTAIIICILALGLLIGFWLLRGKYYGVITELARTQVTNATSDLINDAVAQQITGGHIAYDRIVYFEKDLNGRITALKTNMTEVNRLKTDILNIINDEILELDTSDIGIPVGSLILPEFLIGRGFAIPVQVLSIRNSDAAFTSNFSQAGINQTLHQLTMQVSVDVAILVLGRSESFTVSSQVVVAETIIVGQVPDTFFQTGGYNGS
jgi:sporulation protein YunB